MIFGEVIATASGVVLLREMGGIGIRRWVVGNNWLYYARISLQLSPRCGPRFLNWLKVYSAIIARVSQRLQATRCGDIRTHAGA